MVGWMLAPLAAFGEAAWWLRLPAVLVPPAAALMLHLALVRWFGREPETADLAALALLLTPINVWNVLVTTDTPLVLFSAASLLAFARAAQKDSSGWFVVAGILLGLAFLSKYFAVLLGLAYLSWAVHGTESEGAPAGISRRPCLSACSTSTGTTRPAGAT
jgi:4-amino-4-deoxy-L-arabinose transferase-like glycosyltransferase